MASNIAELRREALADRVTWGGPLVLDHDFGRVLRDIKEADEAEAREQRRALLAAHTIRCRICHAHSAAGHACMHGKRT